MARLLVRSFGAFWLLASLGPTHSFAQQAPPSSADFPPPEQPAPTETSPPAPAAPPPTAAPAPAPPPAAAPAPAPAPEEPPPPREYQEPPPPPKPPKSEFPGFSVRIDPFNWLLEGKLGFELEVEALSFMTFEMVPIFVVNSKPPTFSYAGRDDPLSRESDGLGPIAGTSLSLGFWLEGKVLKGYVLRAIFTNYGYDYISRDGDGNLIDQVSHVERHFYGYFGSHSRWGAFTIAGGIGLGVELNKQKRCFELSTTGAVTPTSDCQDNELLIKLDPNARTVADLSGGLGGVQIMGRFSLGVSF